MHTELSRHHKKCRSNGGKTTRRNVIEIKDNLHRAWHTLFGNMLPHEIARLISKTYLDPDYQMVCQLKPRHKREKDNQLHLNL
jgi:hypothetical protein